MSLGDGVGEWRTTSEDVVDAIHFNLVQKNNGAVVATWSAPGDLDDAPTPLTLENPLFSSSQKGGWTSKSTLVRTKERWDPCLALVVAYRAARQHSSLRGGRGVAASWRPRRRRDPSSAGTSARRSTPPRRSCRTGGNSTSTTTTRQTTRTPTTTPGDSGAVSTSAGSGAVSSRVLPSLDTYKSGFSTRLGSRASRCHRGCHVEGPVQASRAAGGFSSAPGCGFARLPLELGKVAACSHWAIAPPAMHSFLARI